MKSVNYISWFLCLSILPGCVEKSFDDYFEHEGLITRIEVDADSSDVSVRPSGDSESSVELDLSYFGRIPDYDASVTGTTLKVKLNCRLACDGSIDIKAPASAVSDISADSGDIDIAGMDGDVEIDVDSGDIKMDGLTGIVEASADSGDITGALGGQECYAHADSGNIKLRFDSAPSAVEATVDSGDITIKVPEGEYDISMSVDSGDKDIENLVDDEQAPGYIHAEADSGDIKIVGY